MSHFAWVVGLGGSLKPLQNNLPFLKPVKKWGK